MTDAERPALHQHRAALRRNALQTRAVMAHSTGSAAGRRLRALGLDLLARHPGVVVAGYHPVRGEIDVLPLLVALRERGREVALPVVMKRDAPLVFRRWRPGMALEEGAYGIPHPPPSQPEVRPDIVLVPLLAFDRFGHRLGYGGGYYDRTLRALRAGGNVLAVGCAYSGQELDAIPALETDMPLDLILTDRGIIRP